MTFNIHHGKGTDGKVNLFRIAEIIGRSKADIIGLNEVDRYFAKRSLYEDQIGWLADHLRMDYAFSPSISISSKKARTERQYGNALLSRYPILSKKIHLFNFIPGLMEGRSLLEATIPINEHLFHIGVTHLSLNPFLHRKQTDFIVRHLGNIPHPTIIMGDWNMNPGANGWKKMTNGFQDTWSNGGSGTGNTFPSHLPRKRLDYIFVGRNFKVLETNVITDIQKASDHLPVTSTLFI
jgi:endonuclease/exonuclease/phosphatase family metal-dependent hydrolase